MLESHFDNITDLIACIFIEKETPTQVFFCEYCEIIGNRFFIEQFLLTILFQNFYMILRRLRTSLASKLKIFHISCAIALFSFITLVLKSGVYDYFILVCILKYLISITLTCITTSESETTYIVE